MKTLNTIYLWLMLAACVLALAGCVEEKVSGTGEGGNISHRYIVFDVFIVFSF